MHDTNDVTSTLSKISAIAHRGLPILTMFVRCFLVWTIWYTTSWQAAIMAFAAMQIAFADGMRAAQKEIEASLVKLVGENFTIASEDGRKKKWLDLSKGEHRRPAILEDEEEDKRNG